MDLKLNAAFRFNFNHWRTQNRCGSTWDVSQFQTLLMPVLTLGVKREREKNNTQTITITQKVEPFQMKIRFNQANCWAAFFRAFGPFHSGRGKNTLSTGDPMESTQATVAQGEINQFKGQPTTEHRTQCHLHRKLPETTNLFLWTAVEKTDLFSKGDFYWFASHCRLSHSFSIRFSRQKLLFM